MIKILKYSKGKVIEGSLKDLKNDTTTWIDCYKATKEEIEQISKFGSIPIEIINENLGDVRPRLDEIEKHSLLVYTFPIPKRLVVSSITMFISKKHNLITFRNEKIQPIDIIHKLLNSNPNLLKKPSEIVYSILEGINKYYFTMMAQIEEEIDEVEDEVFRHPDKDAAKKIFKIKKNLIYFHKALVANREVISGIEKQYLTKFTKEESYRFRNLYHDVTQLIDEGETYRDITTGVLDLYMTSVSNNLNIVMKKLTAMASFILIPTLISGIYGMNFQRTSPINMPELYWDYGYFFSLGLMAVSIIVMYIFFKKKKWI